MAPWNCNNLLSKWCFFRFIQLVNSLLTNYGMLAIKEIPPSYIFQIDNGKSLHIGKFSHQVMAELFY